MNQRRLLALVLAGAFALSFIGLRGARPQTGGLRRVTNTSEEGININPSISGDGKILAFESTEDIAHAGGTDHFRAIRSSIAIDPVTFFQMGGTRAVAPAISQDGSRIAFASKDDPLGANGDGNSEIFLFDGAKLIQVTNTSPGDVASRVTNGNFQPSISDDGRFLAFSSNRDLATQNSDGNLEIFIYDTIAGNFTQLTNSSGIVRFSDAKISGNGASVAYIRDTGATPGVTRDLLEQPRAGLGPVGVLASNVQSLAMTYGRAISDDGTRVVYSAETATNSTQVFLFDGRFGAATRQITSLGVRTNEVPLHPTISGDGLRIAFATRRSVSGTTSNSDGSVELYVFDIPSTQVSKITDVPSGVTADVLSSLNDDGSIAAFNFPRILSGAVSNSDSVNNSEIYVTATPMRRPFGTLTVLNGAAFGKEPSPNKAVAPDSIAVAMGGALANSTQQPQRLPNGTFPTNVGGTTVTVNGRAAQIFFVSPGQVNFLVPPQTEIGTADVVVTNSENFASRGTVPTLRAAPGVFTRSGDGSGPGVILNSDTLREGPFDPASGNLRLSIFTTGARNAIQTLVMIGGRVVNAESVIASPDMPGLDEIHVPVSSDLRGAGTVNISVQSDGRDGNPVTVTFTGDPSRAVFINEALADPPDGIAGDANHDGVRDGTQDEFVELVNGTANEAFSLGGWTIRTRATGGTTETTRFTFAGGTMLPASEAIVVFGGGNTRFNPNDPVFGCAQVVKATSSAGLSLTNAGLTVVIRDGSGNLITDFAYGGSTGFDGDNNQSLTRAPDVTGNFVQHTATAGARGRRFSPGLKIDGTPHGNCPGRPTNVAISPPSATIVVGETAQFTAQGFDQFGRAMNGVTIDFASDSTPVGTVDSVSMNSSTGVATANVSGHNPGTAHITASAADGITTINSSQSTLTVTGPSLSINDVSRNEGNSGATTFTFTVSLSTPAPAGGITFNIATQDGSATVPNNDYVARTLSSQTIAAGQQTYPFDVTVNGDLNIESNETFFVNVSSVSGASVTDGQGLGAIVNDDSPVLSIDDVSASEGDSGTTTLSFTVISTLPAPSGGITFDIATADGTAHDHNPASEDNDYVARALTNQTIPAGQTSYTFDVTVNGDKLVEPNETFFVNVSNVSGASTSDGQGLGRIQNDDTALLVISQVYGGGDNSGAPFRNDFVEIFNRGTTTVDFTVMPYSVQYASVGSNFGTSKTNLTVGTIAPGRYFLVQEGGGTTNGVALPTPDAIGSINMAATAGKIALVAGTSALSVATCPGDDGSSPFNPNNAAIADLVGYGNSAATAGHCYEGAGPAPAPSNTTADFRKAGGCADTDQNAVDFFVSGPVPRNISSPANNCIAGAPPNLTINDVTVTEGNSGTTTATFTVSLSAPAPSTDVTFDIATQNNSALSGSDYVARTLTNQLIPAGQTTSTFDVTVNGDTAVEPDETFLVNVTNVTGATVTDGQGVGTIQHDDLPTLSIDDVSASEGNSGPKTFTFHVTLSAAAPATVTFDIATADGTAQDGVPGGEDNDYQALTITAQTIAAGSSSFDFNVTVNGDLVIEPTETLFLNVTNVSGATILDGRGQGTIQNDDSPALSIDDVSADEGHSGPTTFTFHVTLSIPAGPSGVTFDIATADGTAQDHNPVSEDNDYLANSTNHTISAGQSSFNFDVLVNGDTTVEANETFSVNVTNVTGATVSDGAGVGTIQNDDSASVVISQLYGGGGNSGATYKNDFIEVFNPGTSTVDLAGWSVQYTSATGTGTWSFTQLCSIGPCLLLPGRYFLVQEDQGAGGTTNLPPPDATGTIAMTTGAGKVALVSNTIALSGSCPSGTSILDLVGYGSTASCFEGTAPATAPSNTTADVRKGGGCVDTNDNAADFFTHSPAPRNSATPANTCSGQAADIVISDVTVTEGDSGTVSANFTVSLIASSTSTVTVDHATANGTAAAPGDYQAITTTQLVFNPGETSKPVTVLVNGDTLDEPDETFFVNLTNATNAAILDDQGQVTITDDDVPPTLAINDVSQNEGNSGTTTFAFTVHLSAPALTGGATFDIATADGTAQDHNPVSEDSDYVANSLTAQTIPAGSQDYVLNVTVNGDPNIETNETFFVNATNVTGANVGDGVGQGTIQNDDSPTLSIDNVTVAEGNSGTTPAMFTVTLSPSSTQTVTVDYATSSASPATAAAVTDYQSTNGTLTFNPGDTSKPINVLVNGDTTNEAICETFFVNLTNATNATISDNQGQGGIADDDGSKLIITQIYGGGSNTSATFQNDFVEIFNRGASTVDFTTTTYSVQYASAAGTFSAGNTINLTTGSVAPGQYFLIKLAPASPTVGAALPTADASNTGINMSATDGKIALVIGTAVATTTSGCPTGVTVADLVGYGSANCSETTAVGALTAAKSAKRVDSCKDINNNSTDFSVVTNPPAPRNAASTLSPCSCSNGYSSLFILDRNSWRASLANLFIIDRPW